MYEQIDCPFCGSKNISAGEQLTEDIAGETVTQSVCMDCGACGPGAALDAGEVDYGDVKAIAAWNRRATPSQPVPGGASDSVSPDMATRTEEIRLMHANPTALKRSTIVHHVECLLAHIATLSAATPLPQVSGQSECKWIGGNCACTRAQAQRCEIIESRMPGRASQPSAPQAAHQVYSGDCGEWYDVPKEQWERANPAYRRPAAVPQAVAVPEDEGPLAIACIINKKLGEYIAGRAYLLPDDLAALKRFYECATDFDSGGHDVPKAMMARLREIGVVQSIGFGRHQTTSFGDFVIERDQGEPVKLPLKTLAERNALAAIPTTPPGEEGRTA